MGQKVLGIEIDQAAISLALVKNGGKPRLLACDVVQTPDGAFAGDTLNNPDPLVQAVELAVSRNKRLSGADTAAVCINNTQTVVRLMSLPALPDKEMPAAIEYSLSQSFPGVSTTHSISFKEYSKTKEAVEGIVAFSPLKTLEPYSKLARDMSMRNAVVDVSSNAAVKAYAKFGGGGEQASGDAVILCGLNRDSTLFTIIKNEKLIQSRHISDGTRILGKIIRDRFGVSARDYEAFIDNELKRLPPGDPDLDAIIRTVYSGIADALRQTLDFFTIGAGRDTRVSEILLTGAACFLPGLEGFFAETADLPVRVLAPPDGVDQRLFSSAFSAIGAAIRES